MTDTPAKQFERNIIELMRLLGWTVASCRPLLTKHGWRTPVQGDGAGFPDILGVHPQHGILFAELKTGRGKLTVDQEAWRDRIVASGGRYHLWTDRCEFHQIAEELRSSGTQTPPHGWYPHIDPERLFQEAS